MKNRSILLLLSLFLLFSCRKQEILLKKVNIKIFGHGGMGIGNSYPMNSLESLLAALHLGADGTEMDVQMTKDGKLIAYHDELLEGSTNLTGTVYQHSASDFATAYYTNFPLANYHIRSVDEIMKNISDPEKYIFTFDCKLYAAATLTYLDSFKNAIVEIAQKYHLENRIFVESSNPSFLEMMRDTQLSLFIYPDNFQDGLAIARNLQLYGITIANDLIAADDIKMAHLYNIKVTTWNTHSHNDNIDAINKGVDYIQSDKLHDLIALTR